MIEIRWHGRGGQGAFTAAKILGAASLIDNKYSLAFPSFGPERRGAPIQAFNKIDNRAIINRSEIKACDYLIFLDDSLFALDYLKDLKDDGIALINTATPDKFSDFSQIQTIDANQIALKIIGKPISNTAMLGALASISDDVSLVSLQQASNLYLSAAHAAKNQLILKESFEYFKEVH
ncbi:MAG: 2-oxoacid:acceptor oxidoreductase family protein [Acetobacterium sp.]|uniref:2-oxoacid:acceptor oxidoreductase family protein n=1 Tax=Acetobacterium sp. TaxID=1872094 RepID=UPI003241DA78